MLPRAASLGSLLLRRAAQQPATQQHGFGTAAAAVVTAGAARRLLIGGIGLGTFASFEEPRRMAYQAAMVPVRLGRDVVAAGMMLGGEAAVAVGWHCFEHASEWIPVCNMIKQLCTFHLLNLPACPACLPCCCRLHVHAAWAGGGGAGGGEAGVPPPRRAPPAQCVLQKWGHLHQAGAAHRHAGGSHPCSSCGGAPAKVHPSRAAG